MFKFIIILTLTTLVFVVQAIDDSKFTCLGCVTSFEGADDVLNQSLEKLPASHKVKLIKVHKAEKQIISGIRYEINADVTLNSYSPENCDFLIISQPWLKNGIKATMRCREGEKVINWRHN
uniref:Cystatin domain-containing protein n=1 Tax=Stomoxys calcitrans TaxID=35570 RepID=A0A1I8Q9P5_STOCA